VTTLRVGGLTFSGVANPAPASSSGAGCGAGLRRGLRLRRGEWLRRRPLRPMRKRREATGRPRSGAISAAVLLRRAARKAGPTTAATANRRKGPPSAPSADPVPPSVGPTRQAPKACPVSPPEKVTRRKRARVDSPLKQPTTLRVLAAVWCPPGSGNTSVRQQTAPLPQSATTVDQVAELHASRGSMASISGGGITAAVSE
jgi:hypothetical protein